MEFEYEWSTDDIEKFIKLRSKFEIRPNLPATTPHHVFEQILDEIDLSHQVSIIDCEQLWNSLVSKYQSFKPFLKNKNNWVHYPSMYKALGHIGICGPEDSQTMLVDSTGLDGENCPPKTDLAIENPEETIEEEAARLEEAFRTGEIVTLPTLEIDGRINSGEESELTDEEDQKETSLSSELIEDYVVEGSSEDSIWNEELTLKFIFLRGDKEFNYLNAGQKYTIRGILKELGLVDQISVADGRNKWNSLVEKYTNLKNEEESNLTNGQENHTDESATYSKQEWPFFNAMDQVMNKVKPMMSDQKTSLRKKTSEYIWTPENIRKFIRLRADRQSEISVKGHNAVHQEIIEKLMISDKISSSVARKKWNSLLKRYQEEELADVPSTWPFMKDMKQVMKNFRCFDAASKMKSRASPEFLWPNDLTRKFIELRASKKITFMEVGYQGTYMEIMQELGLDHILNPHQLRKKWNYLVAKYKEISYSVGPDGTSPAPHTWPFFEDMKKAMLMAPESDPSKLVKVNYENVWTKDIIIRFIQLRGAKGSQETKKASTIFSEIIKELDLSGQVTPYSARKKWNYLYLKFLDLCQPGVDEFIRTSWPYYSEMQKAVGSLPTSDIISKKGIGEDLDEEGQKQYVCFLCRKSGRSLNNFFIFERDQILLHTQKTAVEIMSHLLNRKIVSMDANTFMCTRCTNLINEADSALKQYEKVKSETLALFTAGLAEDKAEKNLLLKQRLQQNDGFDFDDPDNLGIPNEELGLASTDNPAEEDAEAASYSIKNEEMVSYSKRGRKRKLTHPISAIKTTIKSEMHIDEFESFEDDDFGLDEEPKKRKKTAVKRGRGRGRLKKRGRPSNAKATNLIGKGLGGQYPNSNKRKLIGFKGPKIYYCTECPMEFKKYTDLVLHKRKTHTVVDTSTLEVEETVLENGIITYFNKGKANNYETSHPCKDCDKKFLRKDDLWYHQEIAHTEGMGRTKAAFKDRSYDCEECGENFIYKYKLKMHINSKHLNDAGQTADDFICGECGCKLGSLPGLTFHLRKHHNKTFSYRKSREYLCSHCGFLAPTNKKLKEHQEAQCGVTDKPKVNCEICGKSVLQVSLKMHKIKMHSDFNEQCDRCGERYATKTDLLRHINVVHLKILLYTCQHCGEKFPTSDALRYHRVKQHEKPSFSCKLCMKSYKRIGELNTHMKRAHNDRRKAEACQYCGKEYYDRSGLRNHLIRNHNVPQEMTYSENYLRKKRFNGLPLAKLMEKRSLKNNFMPIADPIQIGETVEQQSNSPSTQQAHLHQMVHVQHQQQTGTQQALQPHQQQPHTHQLATNAGAIVLPQHPQQVHAGLMDEAAEAARNLGGTYQENQDESSLVVTEITENESQVQQTVLVDTHNVHGMVQHPQLTAHMQPPIPMHHHMHHPMQQHPPNARFSVLYQMNMHHPGPSHINM